MFSKICWSVSSNFPTPMLIPPRSDDLKGRPSMYSLTSFCISSATVPRLRLGMLRPSPLPNRFNSPTMSGVANNTSKARVPSTIWGTMFTSPMAAAPAIPNTSGFSFESTTTRFETLNEWGTTAIPRNVSRGLPFFFVLSCVEVRTLSSIVSFLFTFFRSSTNASVKPMGGIAASWYFNRIGRIFCANGSLDIGSASEYATLEVVNALAENDLNDRTKDRLAICRVCITHTTRVVSTMLLFDPCRQSAATPRKVIDIVVVLFCQRVKGNVTDTENEFYGTAYLNFSKSTVSFASSFVCFNLI
eukprot:m.16584 g.16584  ORF g.16584 m.16584 type:complete len:302 (-) comp11116_c0_seq1:60-965(-)